MLHLPRVVVAQPVGQNDLIQRVVKQLGFVARIPGFRQLMFVENPETHGDWLPGRGA